MLGDRMKTYHLFLCITLVLMSACTNDDDKAAENCAPEVTAGESTAGESTAGESTAGNTEGGSSCPEVTCPTCEVCPEVPVDPPRRELNLRLDADNVYAWRKTRASLDPEKDVVFYWVGYIYQIDEKDPADYPEGAYNVTFESPLFRFEGFNVARFAEDGAGYTMLSREVSVYQDPITGAVIDCWSNPLLPGQPEVSVMHVANDPVNFGVGPVNHVEIGDRVSFYSDILISYRSPLAENPSFFDFSASDVYQSNELFNFYASKKDLENEDLDSVPVEISWTRVGQYLPWMQMGDRPGKLIYHVRGYKVMNGIEGLPESLVTWTRDVAGEKFLSAPETVPTGFAPNATTWRVFKDAFVNGEYSPTCE